MASSDRRYWKISKPKLKRGPGEKTIDEESIYSSMHVSWPLRASQGSVVAQTIGSAVENLVGREGKRRRFIYIYIYIYIQLFSSATYNMYFFHKISDARKKRYVHGSIIYLAIIVQFKEILIIGRVFEPERSGGRGGAGGTLQYVGRHY